ncbi:MAG: TatD family hydrolase [Lachnospiraceae bacterium]|nr:TatD family hydrolase [Lachnospiraceae bacterium]
MIFDSHAHYNDSAYDTDRAQVLGSLPAAGIGLVMDVGANKASTVAAADLAQQYDFVYASAGFHPSDTEELERGEADIPWLKEAAERPKVLAIGEIGLDYYWPEPDRALQKKWFAAQLELAKELDMPIIVHSRDAAQDTFDMLKEAGGSSLSAVIHCFSYEKEMAARFLDLGYCLGIGGVVTYKNARKLKEVAEYIPLDRLLLETDCPYLTPTPFRGKRNSSLHLPLVLEEIGRLRNCSPREVEEATFENAKRFYRL